MTAKLLQEIRGHEKLTAIFDGWPSFHDGTLELLTHEPGGFLELTCRIFRMTDAVHEVNGNRYFVLDRHTRTKLRFDGCEEVKMRSIYAGGDIFDLKLEETLLEHPPRPGWKILLDSSTEFELELTCVSVSVVEAELLPKDPGV